MGSRSYHNNGSLNSETYPVPLKGYYSTGLRKVWPVWAWSAVLALLCSYISYPGIWYSDSYVRVTTGEAVLNAIIKALTGNRITLETGNAFTVIPSFIMAVFIGLTGHVALYSFFQAFAFFSAVILLIRELNPVCPRFQYVVFCLSPLIYGVSVYFEANIGCLIGIIALVLLFRRIHIPKSGKGRTAEFLMISLAVFITVGYRTNALTVLPVFLIEFLKKKSFYRKLLPVLALTVGLILVWLIPWCFGVEGESNACTGFVWEIITTIQRMDPADRGPYLDYLDDIGGEGATREVIQTSDENTVDGFMWGEAINTRKLSAPGVTGKVLEKYFRLIREKPSEWFQMKRDFLLRAMGISRPLELSEYDYNRWEQMDEYGFNDSRQRELFWMSFIRMNEVLGFYTRRPWVAFLISAVMLLAEWIRKDKNRELYALLFFLALFSYGAYLVVIVVFELRMFYPALFLLMVLDADIAMKWIHRGFVYVRKPRAGTRRLTSLILMICLLSGCFPAELQASAMAAADDERPAQSENHAPEEDEPLLIPAEGYEFQFVIQLHPEESSSSPQERLKGYADLLKALRFEGSFVRALNGENFELNISVIPVTYSEGKLEIRLSGAEDLMYLSSNFLDWKTIKLNQYSLLPFCSKMSEHLGIPLHYFSLLYPYTWKYGLGLPLQDWEYMTVREDKNGVIPEDSVKYLWDCWSYRVDRDEPFNILVDALCKDTDAEDAFRGMIAEIPDYFVRQVAREQAIRIRREGGNTVWQAATGDFYSETVSERGIRAELNLPVMKTGYRPVWVYEETRENQLLSGFIRAQILGSENLQDLVNLEVSARSLPEVWPMDCSSSLILSQTGGLFPDLSLGGLLTGEADGRVRFELFGLSADGKRETEVLTLDGVLLPVQGEVYIREFRLLSNEEALPLFISNDLTIHAFLSDLMSPMLECVIQFLIGIPASACQALMDDLTDMGIFQLLLGE